MVQWKSTLENMALNFWNNHNVFVTGATGLLGSWLAEELLQRGANVTCLVRDAVPDSRSARSGLLARINVVHGELENFTILLRVLNEYEIDTVFHVGAQTIVGTASRSPLSTFESNIKGTWNLLEACRVCPKLIQRVVVASSDKAYGQQTKLPYTEETPLEGRFPYDVSKSCVDLLSFSFFHTYGTPVTVTRCENLYGGGDLNFNRLIPGTIRSALKNETPIIRSDGKFIRGYFYVRDAVDAYLQLAEKIPDERFLGQAFNFGNEIPISVLDLVQKILRLTGKTALVPKVLNEASHEIREQYLDCSKAKQMLGWRPKFTIDEGLQETTAWYRNWLENTTRRDEFCA